MAKQLHRSRTDKKIAGVCAGIANYFEIDPVVVRILFIILILPGGLPGVLPYFVLWIVVPLEAASPDIKKLDN